MKAILFIMMWGAAGAAHATSQIPEVLIYNGASHDLYATPLETLFSRDHPKPKLFFEHPSSTACGRGYVGTWKIDNDHLYLVALREGHPRTGVIPLGKVNPKLVSPVKATWFTGTLRIGKGKVLKAGVGFSEKREKEIFIEIKQGVVTATRRIDNTQQKQAAGPESGQRE